MDDPDIPDNFCKFGILAKLIAASRSPKVMISSLDGWFSIFKAVDTAEFFNRALPTQVF